MIKRDINLEDYLANEFDDDLVHIKVDHVNQEYNFLLLVDGHSAEFPMSQEGVEAAIAFRYGKEHAKLPPKDEILSLTVGQIISYLEAAGYKPNEPACLRIAEGSHLVINLPHVAPLPSVPSSKGYALMVRVIKPYYALKTVHIHIP